MRADNDNTLRLLNMRDTAELTSLSRTMICRLRDQGRFPLAVPLGDKRIAFVRSEVIDWIDQRISLRRAA